MSQTVSPSTSRCYGLARVSRAWNVPRAGVVANVGLRGGTIWEQFADGFSDERFDLGGGNADDRSRFAPVALQSYSSSGQVEPNSADPSCSFRGAANPPCRPRKALRPQSVSPPRGPGNGILRAETGGRFQAQNAGERPEFGSQTALRLTNRPELRGFLPARIPRRFARTVWWAMSARAKASARSE